MQDTNPVQVDPTATPVATTPAPVATDMNAVATPAPVQTTEPAATTVPGPEAVAPMPVQEVKTDVKVELPEVPATSAATTPVATPTV